jgi:hypothetical protein
MSCQCSSTIEVLTPSTLLGVIKIIKEDTKCEEITKPIRIFRNYLNLGHPVNKYHIMHEEPCFIINSRRHGNIFENTKLMNNIFSKNAERLANRFNINIKNQ